MNSTLTDLSKLRLECRDGTIGKIKDLLFDDESWTVRYLVGETARWLPGRKVLLSPLALVPGGVEHGKLPVNLTKSQVENSPGVGVDEPVSVQRQRELHQYYGWQPYWGASPFPMAGMLPPAAALPSAETLINENRPPSAPVDAPGDPHLRSARHVSGYTIHALDGALGHIEDFIVHLDDWTIRALVVDTRNWLPGRKVVISPAAVDRVSWTDHEVAVHLDRDTIKESPEYHPGQPLEPDFEERLTVYYQGVESRR